MKKSLFILGVCCLFSLTSSAALWRVNNITGVNANFGDLPAAVTAANNGDTIYLEPSPVGYTGTTISKQLTIIGNGYFSATPFNTVNTGLQANPTSSVIASSISFYPGSAGSTIMGFNFSTYAYVYIYTDNISVKRNYFYYGYISLSNYHPTTAAYQTLTSCDIRQNLFYGYGITYNSVSTTGGASFSGISIQNNIFYSASVGLVSGLSGFIQNNVFDAGSLNTYNFQINNNVMIGGTFVANNSVYFNNVGTSTQFGNANSNQQNISTTSLFTNYSGATQTETRYILSPTGPGIGAGFNSVDVGAFGGPDPYKLSGIPPVPTIYSITAPATTTGTTLPVTISTRSNN
ncbi:MAG TPA: hypothetical protein PL009_00775 [Flavipsychrobacter sp.]|nr:hypothetical protein [Flavipsychrobacter sp.]